MWPIPQEVVEFEELCAELRAENALLRELLEVERGRTAALCAWANRLEGRVGTLKARTRRLLRLAKWWRAPGRKPTPEHVKVAMMIRYVVLGGLERGKGEGAKQQVAEEFGYALSTVERFVTEFKGRTVTSESEVAKYILDYRRKYERGIPS